MQLKLPWSVGDSAMDLTPRVLGLVLGLTIGCTPPPPPLPDSDPAPDLELLTGPVWQCQTAAPMPMPASSCTALPPHRHRLTYDLSAAERSTLASQLKAPSGLLVARLQGCEFEILTHCHALGRYDTTMDVFDLLPRQELSTPEELWSNLPRFAAGEGGPVIVEQEARAWMFIVLDGAPASSLRRPELVGACSGATHLVFGLTLGAGKLSASVEAGKTGEELVRVGDLQACAASKLDRLARAGCLEPLDVELLPLGEYARLTPPCITPAVWRSGFCLDDDVHPPEPCMDPALPRCRPGDSLMFQLAPDTLDPSELWSSLSAVACEGHTGNYELTVDGPTGRVIEVCGARREFEAAAARIFAMALPTTRQPGQRYTLSCIHRPSSTVSGE